MRARKVPPSLSDIREPVVVAPSPQNEARIVRLPDDELRIYYVQRPDGRSIRSVSSTDGGLTWSEDRLELDLPGAAYHAVQVFPDQHDELHAVFHIFRGEGRRPGIDRNLDVWHCRTYGSRAHWGNPQRIFAGYVGALRGGLQMKSGRLLVPLSIAVPERLTPPPPGEPDYGWHNIIVMSSDDLGATWQRGPAELKVTLCGENVTRYGAVEPHIIELADGRLWMLIRDRCGRLYESDSPDGIDWSEPRRTPFISSDSPATTVRLPDGRIVLLWCGNQRWDDPRSYAMGGREVLHAAITADEGRTWHGFREVLTEPLPPATRGDRGTAYPSAVTNAQGKVVFVSGQGEGRQAVVIFDPDWLTETSANDDFSEGLSQWTMYGSTGPQLVPHPDREHEQILQIRKPSVDRPAGASWNFPAGMSGQLTVRIRISEQSQGAELWLTDHFSVSDDREAPANAVYRTRIDERGQLAGALKLEPDHWVDLEFDWTAAGRSAKLRIDDRGEVELPAQRPTETGLNYFGIRSLADNVDRDGVWIESIHVEVRSSVDQAAAPGLPASGSRSLAQE